MLSTSDIFIAVNEPFSFVQTELLWKPEPFQLWHQHLANGKCFIVVAPNMTFTSMDLKLPKREMIVWPGLSYPRLERGRCSVLLEDLPLNKLKFWIYKINASFICTRFTHTQAILDFLLSIKLLLKRLNLRLTRHKFAISTYILLFPQ